MAAVPQQSPNPSSMVSGKEQERQRQVRVDKAHIDRQRQALELQRENILSQRTSNPHRRTALEAALKHVEAQIESLG